MDRTSVMCTINGLESYTNLKAVLLDRELSTIQINSLADWMYEATEGTLLSQAYDFRTMKLTFLVEGEISTGITKEEGAFQQISRLTAQLQQCKIIFDDFNSLWFNNCFLIDKSTPERLQNGVFKITYLLNCDFGEDTTQTTNSATFTPVDYYTLEVSYLLNWDDTVGYYKNAFDTEDIIQELGTKEVYVDASTVESIANANTTWDAFYSALGINLQEYRPEEGNTLMGFAYRTETYDASTAISAVQNEEAVTVYYNRYSVEGTPDLPEGEYPSKVWSAGNTNTYYFDLGIGNGWDIQDIEILIWGRYFNTISAGNGPIIGAGEDNPLVMAFTNPNAIVYADSVASSTEFTVMEDTTSGGQIMVQTLESLSDLPLRKYGFKATDNPKGYVDVYFNSVALDRMPIDSTILDNNLTIMFGETSSGVATTGKYADICRVQVTYQGEVVLDAIPIAGNVKNGFINDYDTGFYDIINMKFLGWTKTDGTTSTTPPDLIPLDSVTPGPEPTPTPDYPETPTIWAYDASTASALKELAEGDLSGSKATGWNETTYDSKLPEPGGYVACVYSTPNVPGTFSYMSNHFTLDASGQLDDGRYYYILYCTTSKGYSNQTVVYTPTDTTISATTITFAIMSV